MISIRLQSGGAIFLLSMCIKKYTTLEAFVAGCQKQQSDAALGPNLEHCSYSYPFSLQTLMRNTLCPCLDGCAHFCWLSCLHSNNNTVCMWGQIRPVGELLERWRCSHLTESFLCRLETISGSVDSVGLSWHTHKTKSCPLCVEPQPTFSTGENWVTQQLHNHHIKYNPPLRLFLFSCQRWRQGIWSPVQDRLLALKSILLVTTMTNDRVWYLKNKSEPRRSYTLLLTALFCLHCSWDTNFSPTFLGALITLIMSSCHLLPHWTPRSNNSTVPELTSL